MSGPARRDASMMDRQDFATTPLAGDPVGITAPAVEKSQVQVIARAAAILRALEDTPQGLSLGQIARKVALARSTVQRIVAALEAEKLLIAASPTGRVRLGPALLRLAASVETDFVALARPFLRELSAALRETVDLSALRKAQMVFIDQVVGPQRLRTVSAVGELFPLHCSAPGKATLAALPDGEIERLIGAEYERRTPHTLVRLAPLLANLTQVREDGIAFDRQEHTLGICAAAVALRDPLGNAVSISVPVPSQRFEGREAEIADGLLRTRQAIEGRLAIVSGE
jgi:DNA-binding IclR family transcriptional regulator